MNSAVLLLVEPSGQEIDSLVTGLEAGGVTAIYQIATGNQSEKGPANARRPIVLPGQPDKVSAAVYGLQAIHAQDHDCASIVLVDTRHGYLAEEILAIARAAQALPGCLIIGERKSKSDSSFLARLAGKISHRLVQLFLGISINDLRSGLLVFPSEAVPALAVLTPLAQPAQQHNRPTVEFELELILAGKRGGYPIHGQLVQSGSTGPAPYYASMMLSSMSLYFVMARYVSTSLLTAVVDNLVFVLCYPWVHNLLISIYLARLVAIIVNYFLLRKVVFYSSDKTIRTFPRYVALVLVSGLAASFMIDLFNAEFHTGVVLGKIIAELLLYLINFAVLNKLVFVHRQPLE